MRVRINGTIVAVIQVQDPSSRNPDDKLWKAQVKVEESEVSRHHNGEDQDAGLGQLVDRVSITYPIRPTVGRVVRFTAGLGDGRDLRNPRGIAEWRPDSLTWWRLGG